MAKYSYNITDFPNTKADAGRLHSEIYNSSINTTASGVTVHEDMCHVDFVTSVSGSEETTLSGIIASHSGEPRHITVEEYVTGGYMSTSNTSYQSVVSGTVYSSGGDYNISVSSEVSCEGKVKIRMMDDDTELCDHKYNPGTEEEEFAPYSDYLEVVLTEGTHTILVEYAAHVAVKPVTMQNTYLTIRRNV